MEKKGRLFLLIGSIAVSISLLIGSLSACDSLSDMLYEQMNGVYGDYNIQISTSSQSEQFLFTDECIEDLDYNKSFRCVYVNGDYEGTSVSFIGTTLEEFNSLENIDIIREENLDRFQENGIIISDNTSENFGLDLGDSIEINILGQVLSCKVVGVCSNKGLVSTDTVSTFSLFGSIDQLLEQYGVDDVMYSRILLSIDEEDLDSWVRDYNEKHLDENIIATISVDENSINGKLDWLKLTLYFMLAIILVMTIFIISGTFKLIITERLTVLGTFMSQGATMNRISGLLLLESVVYGLCGGLIGFIGGIIATKVITDYANPLAEFGVKSTLKLNPLYFIIALIFAILLSIISAYLPVRGVKKLQVKDVILNNLAVKTTNSKKKTIGGIICLLIAGIIYIVDEKINYAGAMPSLIFYFVGLMCVIPALVELITGLVLKVFRYTNTTAALALNNLRSSVLLKSTIILITVCIIAILMMKSLGNSIIYAINEAYGHMSYSVDINMRSKNYEEVEAVLDKYLDSGKIKKVVAIGNIDTVIEHVASKQIDVYSIEPDDYLDFEDYMYWTDKEAQLEELKNTEGGIIMSKMVADEYGVNEGDNILLTTDNKEVTLHVISIMDARMYASGNYNLINKETAANYFGVNHSDDYYLVEEEQKDNKSNEELSASMKEDLKGLGVSVLTKAELIKDQEEDVSQLVDILNFITLLTMLIGAISCMSNISISFAQRKKEIAVLNSVGMTTNRCMVMMLLESIMQALLSCAFAFISFLGINKLLIGLYEFLAMDLTSKFPVDTAKLIFVVTLGLVILLSLSTILKNRKLKVIDEIKYE